MKVSKRSILPMVARQDMRYEMVMAITPLSMIVLIKTPFSYWNVVDKSALAVAVCRLNSPTNTLNQNFWSRGLNWMLIAIAKIIVPSPRAVPRPK